MQEPRLRMSFRCNQNPASFKKGEAGFCTRCRKTVHDFTDVPAQEVRILMRQEGGSVCGRIFTDQLEARPPGRGFSFRMNLFFGAFLALCMLEINRSQAQTRDSVRTEQHPPSPAKEVQKDGALLATTDTLEANPISTGPAEKKKAWKRKFMSIGKYNYYIQARFPFVSIRRKRHVVMGAFSF